MGRKIPSYLPTQFTTHFPFMVVSFQYLLHRLAGLQYLTYAEQVAGFVLAWKYCYIVWYGFVCDLGSWGSLFILCGVFLCICDFVLLFLSVFFVHFRVFFIFVTVWR